MIPTTRNRLRAARLALVLLAALTACRQDVPSPNALGDAVPPPPLPPSDGLLTDTAVQTVVEIQALAGASELVERLYDGAPVPRARAAWAMGSMRETRSFQALVDQLSHADPRVRADAGFALGQMPRRASTRWLQGALVVEQDSLARLRFVQALGKAGGEGAADSLLVAASDVDEGALVLALGRISLRHPPSGAVLDRLVGALDHPAGRVRELAAWYFGRAADPEAWSERAPDLALALNELDPTDPAAGALIRALGQVGRAEDLDRVLRFAASPDWRARGRVAAALAAWMGESRARESLFAALDDPSTHVGVAAATTLGGVRRLLDDDLERAAGWVQSHPDRWRVASPLLGALAAQGRGRMVQDWLQGRAGDPPHVRAHGIRALARIPDQGVTRTLMEMAASDTAVLAAAALEGLARRWPDGDRDNRELHNAYWNTFSGAFAGADRGVVAVLAGALTDSVFVSMGSVGLMGEVYPRLEPVVDIEAQQAVIAAFQEIGSSDAVGVLQEALSDPHPVIREAAATALQHLTLRRVQWDPSVGPPSPAPDWDRLRELGPFPVLVLETDAGTVRVRLAAERAPVTVQTVAELALAGRYDGVRFHRVVPDFVIQGGDFERGDGYGGPGFALRTEFSGIPFRRGVIGLAAAGRDTEGSQFFITHSRQPHLDDAYVSFGWVESGMDVVDRIYEGDRILTARVEPGHAPAPAAPGP